MKVADICKEITERDTGAILNTVRGILKNHGVLITTMPDVVHCDDIALRLYFRNVVVKIFDDGNVSVRPLCSQE